LRDVAVVRVVQGDVFTPNYVPSVDFSSFVISLQREPRNNPVAVRRPACVSAFEPSPAPQGG
jgi:hypothetical protein